jgi:hypothetical protein
MSLSDVFGRITAALDGAAIAYMVCGSSASTYHGIPRSTRDIDIIISANPSQIRAFASALPSDKYYVELDAALEAHKHGSMFNVIDNATGWKIDLIMLKSDAFGREEFQRRKKVSFDGVSLFMMTAEDTIVSKLQWSKIGGSHRQLEDVAGILKVQGESLDYLYLKKWIKELALETQWNLARQFAGISETS